MEIERFKSGKRTRGNFIGINLPHAPSIFSIMVHVHCYCYIAILDTADVSYILFCKTQIKTRASRFLDGIRKQILTPHSTA